MRKRSVIKGAEDECMYQNAKPIVHALLISALAMQMPSGQVNEILAMTTKYLHPVNDEEILHIVHNAKSKLSKGNDE